MVNNLGIHCCCYSKNTQVYKNYKGIFLNHLLRQNYCTTCTKISWFLRNILQNILNKIEFLYHYYKCK